MKAGDALTLDIVWVDVCNVSNHVSKRELLHILIRFLLNGKCNQMHPQAYGVHIGSTQTRKHWRYSVRSYQMA